jgi:hypothetical protein
VSLDKKASLFHYVMAGLTIIGLILIYNVVTGTTTGNPISQGGFDVTAMFVLGG